MSIKSTLKRKSINNSAVKCMKAIRKGKGSEPNSPARTKRILEGELEMLNSMLNDKSLESQVEAIKEQIKVVEAKIR